MTGKTHRILGLAAGLTVYFTVSNPEYSPATLAVAASGSYLFSLIPDLDQEASLFWSSLPFGHAAGKIIDPLIKHRKISHSIIGVVIFSLLLKILLHSLPDYWGVNTDLAFWPAIAAYLSHLLADMFTVEGLPLFYPFGKMIGLPPKPFDGIRIVGGQWFENLIIYPLINIYLILFLYLNFDQLKSIFLK